MKPKIIYVDDEPHNLVVFEAAIVEDAWEILTYDNPVKALQALDSVEPSVIVTDQRMPGMMGVQFLELARKIHPNAVRIMATGYSDEDLIVESVRKAQIFDYIRKPWEPDDLHASLKRALDFYTSAEEARRLNVELAARERELTERNAHLVSVLGQLETAKKAEVEMRRELECWAPPFVLRAAQEDFKFPISRDLVGITYDIIQSSKLHDKLVQSRPLRSHILQLFSEALIRHGGWRESAAGDSAYGHFGLLPGFEPPAVAALAAAREFRVALRNLSQTSGIAFECGIALHVARGCKVDLHSAQLQTPQGMVTQKSLDTSSPDVDLLHRIEKLVHGLPGSNIIMSRAFLDQLDPALLPQAVAGGVFQVAGQTNPVEVILLPSDQVTEADLASFRGVAHLVSA